MKPDVILKKHEKFLRDGFNWAMKKIAEINKIAVDDEESWKKNNLQKIALEYLGQATAYREALTNLLRLQGNPTGELVHAQIN